LETNRYLLTDFNTDRWKGIDMTSVIDQVKTLNLKDDGPLFGEIEPIGVYEFHPPEMHFDHIVSLTNASHIIKNLTIEEGKVYGDIQFLNNNQGRLAKICIDDIKEEYRFGIRCMGVTKSERITIDEIITWDVIHISQNKFGNVRN
jgi:hypothetical protein